MAYAFRDKKLIARGEPQSVMRFRFELAYHFERVNVEDLDVPKPARRDEAAIV